MTGSTVVYYLDILQRVRKGKAPTEDDEIAEELLAFDVMYALSLLKARKDKGDENDTVELVWTDSMLLDCRKLAQIMAYSMVSSVNWDELYNIAFNGYEYNRIVSEAKKVESCEGGIDELCEKPYGGFAFSEFVLFKEILGYLDKYRALEQNTSRERLAQTLADLLLGSPTVNSHSTNTI